MPIDSGNLALKGLDDLFSTEENRQEEQREQVQQIPIDALHPFTNHPFKVLDDEAMTRTVESIAQYGVLAPLIARPRPDGDGYEIISGHRRQYAAKLAGLDTLPVIVRQMSDDAAVILMVDSNLQREHILPSERAFGTRPESSSFIRVPSSTAVGRPLRTQSSSMPRGCGPMQESTFRSFSLRGSGCFAVTAAALCRRRPSGPSRSAAEHTARALPSRKRPFVPAELGE